MCHKNKEESSGKTSNLDCVISTLPARQANHVQAEPFKASELHWLAKGFNVLARPQGRQIKVVTRVRNVQPQTMLMAHKASVNVPQNNLEALLYRRNDTSSRFVEENNSHKN